MNVLSNVEFEKLTASTQSCRLQTIARKRCDSDPQGFLADTELPEYIQTCMYSGDRTGAQWLKNLTTLARNGSLDRIRTRNTTREDHLRHVSSLAKAGTIPFDLNDHVLCKETGRYGTVLDYNPETQEFVVVLDPFIIRTCKGKELEKVA